MATAGPSYLMHLRPVVGPGQGQVWAHRRCRRGGHLDGHAGDPPVKAVSTNPVDIHVDTGFACALFATGELSPPVGELA